MQDMQHEEKINELTPAQLVEKLNAGGWFRLMPPGFFSGFESVRKAKYDNDFLGNDVLTIDGRIIARRPLVSLTQSGQILIKEPYIRREQKKKIEGGGWRETPSTRVVFRLVDENFVRLVDEETVRRKEQERQQVEERERQKAAQEVAEAKRREKEGLQRIVRRDQFLTELNQKFNGKKLTAIKLTEQGFLLVEFESGAILKIDLHDESDGYEPVCCLVINGICNCSFKAETQCHSF